MGVCLSKRSELSPRVDAGGGSAASRPESTPQRVDEGYGGRKLGALSRRVRTGNAAAASEHGRESQRRKIIKSVTGDSEAMDTGASGLNPPMPREGDPGARDAEAGDAAAAVAAAGDRAGDAAELVLPECPQEDGLRVTPPDTSCLEPVEGWERPDQARVTAKIQEMATRLGATSVHVDEFLDELREPKAVGPAPHRYVFRWVSTLANAVASGLMDYANRFAYGGFNLVSAFAFAAMNTWNMPNDCNMVRDPQTIREAVSAPAVDSHYTLFKRLVCKTKRWENAFVETVFSGRNIDCGDVGDVPPDGHPSYNEFPGYKAADEEDYPAYFKEDERPPEPENFGAFPPDASFGATAYVLESGKYPLFSVNGKGPNLRTLELIEGLGGKYEKLGDGLARELGSRYGLNSIEYADKKHYGMFLVFVPDPLVSGGHLMLLTLNPQFGSTTGGAHGGGHAAHAELLIILKTQADVIRTLSDCDVLPMDDAHPLWRLVGEFGMREVFTTARKIREVDGRGKRYETVRVRNGRKYGLFGPERTPEQIEQDLETTKRGGKAHVLRDFPQITCPLCGASDVRLLWSVILPNSVSYHHKRRCGEDGNKTKSKNLVIDAVVAWREFLRALTAEQFKAHKEDVLRERFQRLTC